MKQDLLQPTVEVSSDLMVVMIRFKWIISHKYFRVLYLWKVGSIGMTIQDQLFLVITMWVLMMLTGRKTGVGVYDFTGIEVKGMYQQQLMLLPQQVSGITW